MIRHFLSRTNEISSGGALERFGGGKDKFGDAEGLSCLVSHPVDVHSTAHRGLMSRRLILV
jgi:hypothetical protein